MKTTCTECGGTGRCIHCHGTGVLAPIFWHEGSRGPGEGLRCSHCSRGDCPHCFGTGRMESLARVEKSPLPASESSREVPASRPSQTGPELEEEEPFTPLFFA